MAAGKKPAPKATPDTTAGQAAAPHRASEATHLPEAHRLPWSETPEERRLLWQSIGGSLLGFGLLFLLLSLLEPEPIDRQELERVPTRLAEIALKKKEPPPEVRDLPLEPPQPAPEPEPEPEPVKPKSPLKAKPEPEPEPVPEPEPRTEPEPAPRVAESDQRTEPSAEDVREARQRAAQSGVMALKDELSAMQDLAGAAEGQGGQSLRQSEARAAQPRERQLIGRRAESRSGGIETTAVAPRASEQLASREVSRVEAPAGAVDASGGGGEAGGGAGSGPKTRSNADVKLVFDRNASGFYALYRRALRSNLGLEGRVVFDLAIRPDGSVAHCNILSSSLGAPELELKLRARCTLIDFGKEDVARWQDSIAIDFAPRG